MMDCREKAPEKGTVYALLRTKVIFESYESLDEVESIVKSDELLELHLFDKEKEYRRVLTRDGFKSLVIMDTPKQGDSDETNDVYEENVFVLGKNADQMENLEKRVTVVNYITYNEDDVINIRNYRLKEVE